MQNSRETFLSMERNPFSAQNQTRRSYRVYISPTKLASSALNQIETGNVSSWFNYHIEAQQTISVRGQSSWQQPDLASRPVTSSWHQEGRRVFWEGPKFFELCPIVLDYVQHIFPGGTKNFLGWLRPLVAPLVTGLLAPNTNNVAFYRSSIVSGGLTLFRAFCHWKIVH